MSHVHALSAHLMGGLPTANDRLKQRFTDYFWGSIGVAAGLHFLALSFWPSMTAEDVSIRASSLTQIEVPLEIDVPPPPEAIERPAVPMMSANLDLDVDITISPTTFSDNPPAELPSPPVGRVEPSENPAWIPHEVSPDIRNRAEFAAALARRYPPNLRDAGIGGTVRMWVFIDEAGTVRNTRVDGSSGYEALDRLADELIREVARFSPALNRDQRVAVWIQLPVTFEAR